MGFKKNRSWSVLLTGLSILLAFLAATYFEKKQIIENDLYVESSMQSSLNSLMREIRQSLEIYSLELNTIRSFIYSTGIENLSHDLFHAYSKHSEFEKNYPGARGFGFIRYVDIDKESAFIDQASQDRNSRFKVRFLEEHLNSRFIIGGFG